MPISGHPISRPQRHRLDTMGNEVEASPERLRNHLRRPDADEDQLIMKPPLTPLIGQTLPGLLGLMSDLRAGCGVRPEQAVKGVAPSGFDPCAPAGSDKFPPSKEL